MRRERPQPSSLSTLRRIVHRRDPLGFVIASVIVLAGTMFGLVYYGIGRVQDETDVLAIDGGALRSILVVEAGATSIEVFIAERQTAHLDGSPGPVPAWQIARTEAAVSEMQDIVAFLWLQNAPYASQLDGAVTGIHDAFLSYVNTRSEGDLARLQAATYRALAVSRELQPQLDSGATAHFMRVDADLDALRWTLIVAAAVTVPLACCLVLWMGLRYRGAIRSARLRAASLQSANEVQLRRNAQFAGLYQVVTEVSETLNLRYVVDTTVREVITLVDADLVVLRVLEGSSLRAAGQQTREGFSAPALPPEVPLGVGLVGRAARRGRIMRADGRHQLEFVDGPADAPDSSGVVVPLIVGARVVGTVACWSALPDHFSDDDLQLLEMMGSQVATAIAAANMQEETDHSAHHDALTGLPNRRQLEDDIRTSYDAAVKAGLPMAMAMVDVDHFKVFNDEHGHQSGDVALQRVAETLAASVRGNDRVYRYGGEEFAIVFGAMEVGDAVEACERLRKAVAAAHVGEVSQMKVTISAGLAASPGPYKNFRELLTAADGALYRAKGGGRDRVAVAGARDHHQAA
jgi:diguanylate cyclase (GGDEF)-like protein